jgi:hypothetical protein
MYDSAQTENFCVCSVKMGVKNRIGTILGMQSEPAIVREG